MRRLGVLLSVLFALSTLAACGDDDSGGSDGGGGPVGGDAPSCSDIWVAGDTLPEDYDGCENDDGDVEPVFAECTDGTGLASYDRRFWAITGGEIKDAGEGVDFTNDDEYAADFTACQGS